MKTKIKKKERVIGKKETKIQYDQTSQDLKEKKKRLKER